uniref:WD_REPEATS_REGION domain-containing protein n=1 Tax=Heterorhabditis bacteriophora TaxID=37862 RepID=A0A1I7WBK0_HETBA
MRVKVLSRNPDDYQRETNRDIYKLVRNWNAPQDPFRAQTEYTRALNATKLERVFAKPFVASLDGHLEGVHLIAKHPGRPSIVITGARDGQVKIWQLANRHCLSTIQSHHGPINGLSVDVNAGDAFVTTGQDCQLKYWKLPNINNGDPTEPAHSISLNGVAYTVSHLAKSSDFVTCGDDVSVWKINRDSPIRTYNLGPNTIHTIRANPIEEAVMVGAMSDRSIFILDTRQKTPLKKVFKVTMKLRPNAISWNPIEAFTFAVASDDYNLYTFDMRFLSHPKYLHSGHTAAVIDIDYSPTGQEFVSGSFDRSIRIFNATETRSRDVYHTKRMANVLSVMWSMDNKFVLSGSNDMNVRVWKANAAEKLGPSTNIKDEDVEFVPAVKKAMVEGLEQ